MNFGRIQRKKTFEFARIFLSLFLNISLDSSLYFENELNY